MLSLSYNHVGKIFSVKDAIVQVAGLDHVTAGEMIQDTSGNSGLVLNLEFNSTGIVMFNDNVSMSGDLLKRTFNTLSVSIDFYTLGNVWNSIGNVLSEFPTIGNFSVDAVFCLFGTIIRGVELKAPGIIVRQPVYETVFTGLGSVDSVFPIGSGQRELIIGDRQTGKTTVAFDSFLNQSGLDFYVSKSLYKKNYG